MNFKELLCGPLGQRLAWTLLHFLWQGLLISAGVAALGWLLSPSQARGRYAAALTGLVLMVCCPLATFGVLQISSPPPVAVAAPPDMPAADPQPPAPVEMPAGYSGIPTPHLSSRAVASEPLVSEVSKASPFETDWRSWLAQRAAAVQPYSIMVWLAGVVVLSGRLLMSVLGVRRLSRGRVPVCEELPPVPRDWHSGCGFPARRAFSSRNASTRRCSSVSGSRWSSCRRLGSPRCRRTCWKPSSRTSWPTSAAWTFGRTSCSGWWRRCFSIIRPYGGSRQRRACCGKCAADELAVQATGDRVTYASVLEHLGRRRLNLPTPQLAAGIGGRRMALFDRVRNVLGVSPADQRLRWWPVGLLALFGLAGALAGFHGNRTVTAAAATRFGRRNETSGRQGAGGGRR